ncbi:hypothetical protein Aduo_012180 [Ancylostoma duodenale]
MTRYFTNPQVIRFSCTEDDGVSEQATLKVSVELELRAAALPRPRKMALRGTWMAHFAYVYDEERETLCRLTPLWL